MTKAQRLQPDVSGCLKWQEFRACLVQLPGSEEPETELLAGRLSVQAVEKQDTLLFNFWNYLHLTESRPIHEPEGSKACTEAVTMTSGCLECDR